MIALPGTRVPADERFFGNREEDDTLESYSIILTTSLLSGRNFKGGGKVDKVHEIQGLSFDGDRMRINIDGKDHVFGLKDISSRLLRASQRERETFEVSPSGYGIHWPMVDEDLSIDGLLGIRHPRRGSEISAQTDAGA